MVELIETLTNEHLYPPLLEVPNDNSDLADALEFFEDDIAGVSAFVLEFFAKYLDARTTTNSGAQATWR